MLASACPQSISVGTRQSIRRHKAIGSAPQSRCISVSAATVTHATPSTPTGVPTMTREREVATAITLIVADATIVARTKARALAYRGLRPLANTSSMPSSHHGTDRQPSSHSRLWLEDYRLACQCHTRFHKTKLNAHHMYARICLFIHATTKMIHCNVYYKRNYIYQT